MNSARYLPRRFASRYIYTTIHLPFGGKSYSTSQFGQHYIASYDVLNGPHQRQRNILNECVNKNNDDDDDDNKNSYGTEWYRTFSTSKYSFSSGVGYVMLPVLLIM